MARPRIEINWKLVDSLCAIHCTKEEIASVLGIDADTLNNATKREHNMVFSAYFEQKSAKGKQSLRRRQWETANGTQARYDDDGNLLEQAKPPSVAMQIWLGKQWLGQRDKQDIDMNGELDLKVNYNLQGMKSLPKEVLEE